MTTFSGREIDKVLGGKELRNPKKWTPKSLAKAMKRALDSRPESYESMVKNQLEAEIAAQATKITDQGIQIIDLTRDNADLSDELRAKTIECIDLTDENEDLRGQLRDKDAMVIDLTGQLEGQSTVDRQLELSDTLRDYNEAKATIAALRAKEQEVADAHQKRLDRRGATIAKLRDAYQRMKDTNGENVGVIDRNNGRFKKYKEDSTEKYKKLQSAFDTVGQTVKILTMKVTDKEKKIEALEAEVRAHARAGKQAFEELSNLQFLASAIADKNALDDDLMPSDIVTHSSKAPALPSCLPNLELMSAPVFASQLFDSAPSSST